MSQQYTALIRRDGDWWIGWIEEIDYVVSQGETREELLENLRSALEEALEMSRNEAKSNVRDCEYEEVSIAV